MSTKFLRLFKLRTPLLRVFGFCIPLLLTLSMPSSFADELDNPFTKRNLAQIDSICTLVSCPDSIHIRIPAPTPRDLRVSGKIILDGDTWGFDCNRLGVSIGPFDSENGFDDWLRDTSPAFDYCPQESQYEISYSRYNDPQTGQLRMAGGIGTNCQPDESQIFPTCDPEGDEIFITLSRVNIDGDLEVFLDRGKGLQKMNYSRKNKRPRYPNGEACDKTPVCHKLNVELVGQ